MAYPRPCLSVPSSRRNNPKGGKRKRNNNHSNNDNDDDSSSFDNIDTMDASDYLNRVIRQANTLPDIFVSSTHDMDDDKNNNKHDDPLEDTKIASTTTTTTRMRMINPNHKKKDYHYTPIDGSAASLSYLLSNQTSILLPPTRLHLPKVDTQQWVDQTLANFSQLRLYLEQCRARTTTQKKHNNNNGKQQLRQPVPPMKDRPGWHIFCVGWNEAHGNIGSYFADDDDDNDDPPANHQVDAKENENKEKDDDDTAAAAVEEEEEEEKEAWKQTLPKNGYAPTIPLLLQMDQVMIRNVIHHLVHYIKEGWCCCTTTTTTTVTITKQRSIWLYALLARLEKPIHINDSAILYTLLKECTKLRSLLPLEEDDTNENNRKEEKSNNPNISSHTEKEEAISPTIRNTKQNTEMREQLAQLNLLIVIVGIYFEQGGGYSGVMSLATPNKK